ncbi:MAG: hypothetical protein K2H15_03540, partial [Muribaculaceae bacterium]|nr:hypothetical protein [Muribaculaceae bacterium]
MSSNQSLNLDMRQQLRLSAQQLRFVKLLEFNAPELEEAVERELEDNPALEAVDAADTQTENIPYYRARSNNSSPDDFADYDFSPPDSEKNLYDTLLEQISERSLSPNVRDAAEYIIGNL